MNQIPVGERILEERSRNRFTQEELARRLGVSKAAVSKWECGQSMPDIALLPKIASLFSITLDDLLGYEPVAAEEVREETRRQLAELLAEDIRRACDYAEDRAALYWSDPELLRTVGLLLYTRFIELADAGEPDGAEGAQPVAELAERLLRRTLQLDPSSPSADLTLQTLCMLLAFEGRDGQAAELVERMVAAKPNIAAVTLAGVQVKAGDSGAGVRTLKRQLLCSLLEAASCVQALAGLQSLALADLEQLAALAEGIWLPSGFEAVAPTLAPFVRIAFATRLVESGETERAMDELERFAQDLEKCCKTFESPQNPPLFQAVDDLLWQEGGEEAQAARSEAAASLRSSLVGGVVSSESWAPLRGNPRYESLIRQMAGRDSPVPLASAGRG